MTSMPSSAIPEDSALVAALTEFARELRSTGILVGSGQVTSYCRALATLDPGDLRDLYWAGRACLVSRQADLAVYDDAFAHHFLHDRQLSAVLKIEGAVPKGEIVGVDLRGTGSGRNRDTDEPSAGMAASEIEILRNKDFGGCTDEELDALRRLMAEVLVAAPLRLVRRTERARTGRQPDLRRALRDAVRTDGVVFLRRWRRRRHKPRPLVLLLDISGSMAEYSRALRVMLGSRVRYIGMLGPKARLDRILGDLRAQGIEILQRDLERIHGPAGLDIGAEGPEEIAYAIMAEILAVRRGHGAGFLRERKGAIHSGDIDAMTSNGGKQ